MELATKVLFSVYFSLYLFNMVLNGFLYLKNKNDVYKQVFGYWATSLIVFILGGVFQQLPLGVILSFGLSIFPVCYFVYIHAKEINYSYSFKNFALFYGLVLLPLTIFLYNLQMPFYIVGIPFTLGSSYIVGKYLYLIKRDRFSSLTFTQKFYVFGLIYTFIVQALFPLSTLTPELSLMGWSLAFTVYVLFSIILPSFALESIHLNEEKRLNEVVKSRTQELRSTLKDKESLFRTIIHDINNPLNTIMLSLETYQKSKDLESRDKIVKRVNRNVSIVNTVISDVTCKYMDMVKEKVDICSLSECFSMTKEIFEDKLNEKNISLSLNCSGKSDFILNIDKITFVTSVLNNLVSNAIKFSFNNSEIHIFAKEENGEIIIEVKDYGSGMSQIKVDSLISNSLQTSTKGTSGETGLGLGFGQVKHYIESLNGSIELNSKERQRDNDISGTSVRLVLDKHNLSGTSSYSNQSLQ